MGFKSIFSFGFNSILTCLLSEYMTYRISSPVFLLSIRALFFSPGIGIKRTLTTLTPLSFPPSLMAAPSWFSSHSGLTPPPGIPYPAGLPFFLLSVFSRPVNKRTCFLPLSAWLDTRNTMVSGENVSSFIVNIQNDVGEVGNPLQLTGLGFPPHRLVIGIFLLERIIT